MRNLTQNPLALAVAMSIAATSYLPSAWSQDEELDLEEVVVTARKREENLQEVPLSVTAFSESALQDYRMFSPEDIAGFTPGFSFVNSFGRDSDRPVIRGMSNILGAPNASFFIDGVYVPGTISSTELQMLERVEVIKGPVVTGDATGRGGGTLLPEVGDEVFARVLRINPRQVWCEIVAVNGKAVNDASGFQGIVRQQDVRATEIDKVDMYESFLPADVIRAKVLSLGDQRSYYLTTARNELGVVQAKSPFTGEPMVPVSWQEMMCPSTQVKVSRKVAKVD